MGVAAGATYSKKSPSDSVCADSKNLSSLLIIGDRSANKGGIILFIEWNDLWLWNRLVPLSNELLLEVSLLAKFILLLPTSTLIKPNVRQR